MSIGDVVSISISLLRTYLDVVGLTMCVVDGEIVCMCAVAGIFFRGFRFPGNVCKNVRLKDREDRIDGPRMPSVSEGPVILLNL